MSNNTWCVALAVCTESTLVRETEEKCARTERKWVLFLSSPECSQSSHYYRDLEWRIMNKKNIMVIPLKRSDLKAASFA